MTADRYAGLVSRVVALLIDVLLLIVGNAAVYLVLIEGSGLMLGGTPSWARPLAGVLSGVLPTAYFTLAWWLTGQTAGGVAMGVVVTSADGSRVGLLRALLRALVGLALAPLWLIGMITILIDGRRRALLDMLFGTVVTYGGARPNPVIRPQTG
ncbi:RDD family protein [Nonomuraea sp. NBC_01738]|uniref:RDD family protein n=1 Tax=Nonomuraea sp. NBC_01738 TaxID=2976003 RepID=UPI002E122D4D|nr:RDD family protein [Nonomuraea sp. NBC_01738]